MQMKYAAFCAMKRFAVEVGSRPLRSSQGLHFAGGKEGTHAHDGIKQPGSDPAGSRQEVEGYPLLGRGQVCEHAAIAPHTAAPDTELRVPATFLPHVLPLLWQSS